MPVPKRNVELAKRRFAERLGNAYVFGGMWSPTNLRQGTDCSGLWNDILGMCRDGEAFKWGREREGATTQSYRYISVGGVGPFGTIRVARPQDVPPHAVARIAFHHGPGDGANSHMWGELDGVRMESAGSKGAITAPAARAFTDSYANAWAYLPGPIDGAPGAPPPPAPAGTVYLQIGSTGEQVRALQDRLNRDYPAYSKLDVDGEFGPLTDAVVREFQRRANLEVDGIAGPATLSALGLGGAPGPTAPGGTPPPPASNKDRYALAVIAEGRRLGITQRGIAIGLATVYVESNFVMYANAGDPETLQFPHEKLSQDYNSSGLFQQRPPWWGTAADRMDATRSARLFFEALKRYDYNSDAHTPGWYAAEVQRPDEQYRGRYDGCMGDAWALYNRLQATPQTTPQTPTPKHLERMPPCLN